MTGLIAFAAPKTRWLLSAGLLVAAVSLALGLFLPVVRIDRILIFEDYFALATGAIELIREEETLLGLIVLAFSVLFPTAKLLLCLWIWLALPSQAALKRWLDVLHLTGKWSMLDVFVVALLVLTLKSTIMAEAVPEAGLYFFTLSVLLTMVCAHYLEKVYKEAFAKND